MSGLKCLQCDEDRGAGDLIQIEVRADWVYCCSTCKYPVVSLGGGSA